MHPILIGTGSFSNLERGNVVSISSMETNYPTFHKLVPRDISYQNKIKRLKRVREEVVNLPYLKELEDDFIKDYYQSVLKHLYIEGLMKEMRNRFGEEIILATEEDADEFNHRRIFADYLELETGVYIPEVVTKTDSIQKIQPVRYKKRLRKIIGS